MAKASVNPNEIFPDVDLHLSHEEAKNLTKLLSMNAVDSEIDTFATFEAMNEVMGDYLPPVKLMKVRITRQKSGCFKLWEKK